jgi:hypothetical protein
MTRERLDGLYLLLLGTIPASLLLCYLFVTTSPIPMKDFKSSYYSARCLMQHCDPYQESEVLRIYRAEGGDSPLEDATHREAATRYVYPPTAFSFTVPFAMLPWGTTRILWIILTAGSLLIASLLAWDLGADHAPILSGVLIGYLLANSEVLMVLGNPSGIVIGLCVVAVWCFLRERFVSAGILCLAVSLAVKPQEAGLVWLYFLLAGGIHRKRALQTLLATIVLSLPGLLWAWRIAPHWMQELHHNILAFAVHGELNDPGPSSNWAHGLVDLQVVISFFRDDPRIYNPVSYFICAMLLLVWVLVTLRARPSPAKAWLALAAIVPLTLLPVHHHLYDTKLLLLTVPACAMLWAEGGLTGRLALLVNAAGFVLTGDISWSILYHFINHLRLHTAGTVDRLLAMIPVVLAPLILLVMGAFYLWVYTRRCSHPVERRVSIELV